MAAVLVIDSDGVERDRALRTLRSAGLPVAAQHDSGPAVHAVLREQPEVIVAALTPDGDGTWPALRLLRARHPGTILVVSHRQAPGDAAGALDAGADDYLAQPYHPPELAARVRRLLARADRPVAAASVLVQGVLTLDLATRSAVVRGRPVDLTAIEFDLLAYLAQHPRLVIDRAALLRGVWGHSFGDAATVTVHVRRLRMKIEHDPTNPTLLRTRRGMGYWLDPDEADVEPAALPVGYEPRAVEADGTIDLTAHERVPAARGLAWASAPSSATG